MQAKSACRIGATFRTDGRVKTFLVGGAVRDRLLGIEPDERDWVVLGATPAEMEALGFRRLDTDFPVFAHPDSGEEYALARREKKSGEGHKGFVVEFGPEVTLEEDLRRRDLRVNAMAESAEGELVDPVGGLGDLNKRVLRHVSPAFVEDPLRVLRCARLAARLAGYGFQIDPSTRALMKKMSAGEDMHALSGGRIWRELEKALRTESPATFFSELETCGALPVVLPELAPAGRRDGTSLDFSVLDIAAGLDPRPEIRFATLVNARTGVDPVATVEILDRLGQRFPLPRKYAELARMVPLVYTFLSENPDAAALYAMLESVDAFRRAERFTDALAVCDALDQWMAGPAQTGLLRRAFEAAAAVSGDDTVQSGVTGKDAGAEIRRRRIRTIEESLNLDAC